MKYLIILVGGFLFFLVRSALYGITKLSHARILNSIKKTPSKAHDYILNLSIVYNKRQNTNHTSFELIKKKIESSPVVGAYTILHTLPINEHQLLVFTALSYTDFDVTIAGSHADIDKKSYHDFLLTFNKEKAELTVNSSLYINATDKFQKEEFFKSLLETNLN